MKLELKTSFMLLRLFLTAAGVYKSRQISLLRYTWLIICLISTSNQRVKQKCDKSVVNA